MASCNKQLMCDLELYTRDDAKEWLLKNHPDKGGNADLDTVKAVVNCYKLREYCAGVSPPHDDDEVMSPTSASNRSSPASASSPAPPARVLNKKQRNKIYACMRQTENWSNMLPQHKLDSKKFNPATVMAAIHNASPKLEQLFNIIKQVDENDMATHGRYFKHFIFSDVKEQGYGAKILASAFIANGYKNLITTRAVVGQKALKLTLLETGADGKNKAFGLLSSSALFNSEFNQKFKKEILQMYNKRPDNIQGENMRFIILDSGFKEGIDLFDVKYVHIFEPSMTVADLKQTIGRATRTCGQKGLNFEPNVGWPLYVYNYYIVIPEDMKESYKVKDLDLLENPEEDEVIFRNANKLKDATMVYSEFDKTLTTLAEQLYKLAPVFSVDFELTKNIHRMDDAAYLYDAQQQQIGFTNANSASMTSLTGGAQTLKDIATIKCAGKCGLRSTKDIPATVNFLVKVYKKHKHNAKNLPAKEVRKYLCNYMKSSPDYCQQVNTEWANRAAMIPDEVYKETVKRSKTKTKTQKRSLSISASKSASASKSRSQKKPSYLDIKPNKDTTPYYLDIKPNKDTTPYAEIGPGSSTKRSSTKRSTRNETTKRSSKSKSTSALKIADEVMQELDLIPYVPPSDEMSYAIVEYTGKPVPAFKQSTPRPPSKKLNFTQMRDYIRTNFSEGFTWDPIVVENKCVEPGQKGGASRIMNLNPTQDFIRTFFTPASPYKGVLLWHSVGTGKCHALNTPILMYDGTIKMVQDIVVGDKLMGDDSTERMVKSLARGQDTLYDIIPTKGEKYTVNSEHILCLKYSGTGSISFLKNRQKNFPYKAAHIDNKTVSIKGKSFATKEEAEKYLSLFTEEDRIVEIEVKDYLKLSKSLQRELKGYRKGVEFTYKPVDFDPYIIGLWLGDGSRRDPVISSQDSKILKYLMNEIPKYGLRLVHQSKYDYRLSRDGTTKTNVLIDALKKYNLLNNKHIPYEYKCNNRVMRLKLLAGLIDTDGSYSSKDKCYEITQKSNELANDILFLARSLGFAAYNKKCNKSWTYKGITKTNEYNKIIISGNGLEEVPVQITRKMAELRCQKKDTLITGITVEKATDCGDYYGFTLDGNCRYLLGDFTVTHNTCSAIATATASFEPEDYTILWVTRNTLKGDVYKNMFDDVCHIILAERMKKDGFVMPEDPAKRKRLLSKNWIEPISYKTFSNLLTPGAHNVYMDKLIERNGEADILRKTLIVIDEAHKLYGGDLKPSERPNMEIMERLLQKSYELSGKDSARLLIMTATPFTNSPMELFKLINLCKDNASEKITTDIKEFKKLYMNSDAGNILSEAGSKKLADKLCGYISYLNREQDPTQFAQPIMIEVPVIMSHIEDPDMRQEVFSVSPDTKADKLANKTMMKTQLEVIKVLKTRLKETQKRSKDDLKRRQAHCKTIKNRAEKAKCMNDAKQEIEDEVKKTVEAIKAELAELTQSETTTKETGKAQKQKLKNMKEKIKELRESLLQEVMLVEKCKHLKLA